MKNLFQLLLIMLTLAPLATAQGGRPVVTAPGWPRAQPSPDPGPQLLELRCRGGGLQITVTQGQYKENDLYMNMTVRFQHANDAAGINGGNLGLGQCALPDRALTPAEPTEMRAEVINFGQRNRQMHDDPVYKGDAAAERYPDAQNIPPYLANAEHYWSFFGFNTFDGYFRITNLKYWKPIHVSGKADRTQVERPAGNLNNRVRTTSDVNKVDPDPIPNDAVRIRIRYKQELGYLSTQSAFGNAGPYSCNAFTVDAHTGGLGGYKSVGSTIVTPSIMRTEGAYYVCGFTIEGLPHNQTITINADLVNDPKVTIGMWKGPGSPHPPSGYQRAILKGLAQVTLTGNNPFDIVTFEMTYAPVATPPR